MAKTKFLSRVLAVLMALSMLCSTGVLADYDSGLTTTDGTTPVTGALNVTSTSLNGKIAFWGADTVDVAKWFDVNDGLKLTIGGTIIATGDTSKTKLDKAANITYAIAPVDAFEGDPFDPELMEATAVAIGTADIVGGEFNFTIEADKAKLVKNTTYELRLAYSKAEIADVTDASALVYQRYFKSFDWADADADVKATRTIEKLGFENGITIDIEGNPIRSAAFDASTLGNATQRLREKQSVTHIRTADLKTGDPFHFSSSSKGGGMPDGFNWPGETGTTKYTTTSTRRSMFTEVGTELRGGVVLAQGVAEPNKYFGAAQQNGNPAYRFKATQSGTVYILGTDGLLNNDWDQVSSGNVNGYYNEDSVNYLYVASEITADMLTAANVADVSGYLAANNGHAVQTADAPGYYKGSATAWQGIGTTFYNANTAYITPEGYFQAPPANLDANGEWKLKANKPYSMSAVTNYGYTTGRGWITQEREFGRTYAREFEAGEWVEIPYFGSTGASDKTCAVLQFDVPVAPLVSASVTTTKSAFFSDALPMLADEAVAFEGENYEIVVPRGTESVSFTVANVNGAVSDVVTAKMDAASKVVKATIGDAEYDITVKFDDAYPTIYNYKNNSSYDKNNRIAIQYGDMGTPKINGKKTNAPDGSELTSLAFAKGAVKPALTKDLLVIGAYDNKGLAHMTGFDWKEKTRADGMTFNVSKAATVYVRSVAYGALGSPSLEAAGFTRVGTLTGFPLYAKHYNAGEAVSIPTEPVTQAELDAKNAGQTAKKYFFVDDTNKDLKLDDGTTAITSDAAGLPIQFNIDAEGKPVSAVNNSSNPGKPTYYTRTQSTIFYVEFDQPLVLGNVTYAVDGGDAEAITFAEGETTANVEVPYNATTVSVEAKGTGTGTVTVEPEELDLTGVASAAATVTLAAPTGDPIVYTINFVKTAQKLDSLTYTTALAVTKPTNTNLNNDPNGTTSYYKKGFYHPTLITEAKTVAVAADATTINVTVPYGTEIVNLAGVDNHDAAVEFDAINLINNNGAATVTTTVGEVTYTINVKWAAHDDPTLGLPAGNMIYDFKYQVADLATAQTHYNVIPMKFVFSPTRLAHGDFVLYDAQGNELKKANTWLPSSANAYQMLAYNTNGAPLVRTRVDVRLFENWTKCGYITETGVIGKAMAADATVEQIDAISAKAMNGAMYIAGVYNQQTKANIQASTSVNKDSDNLYEFKVAQDSIVFVASDELNPGEGWTKLSKQTLNQLNRTNTPNYKKDAETGELTHYSEVYFVDNGDHVGTDIYYRYAAKDTNVEVGGVKTWDGNSNAPAMVFVREIDIEAPEIGTISYKIGDGEATAAKFAEGETTATVPVPWGNQNTISLEATISGQGSVDISDAIALSKANPEGAITVTVKNLFGEAVGTYTVNFVWAAAPAVEAVTYSTARTLYKGAVVADEAIAEIETQEIKVPWGTDSVTVSYDLEGADAVALKAVNFVDGVATVEVELPEETITLTFTYGAAPAGQYITGLTKYPNSWRDRMFVSYGDVDDAYMYGAAGYAANGTGSFFGATRVPEGLAKKGYTAVIADAAANSGLGHMALENFPYMGKSYPAVAGDGSDAFMSFTVAKAGKLYAVAPQFDEVWVELENLGWTEAPFKFDGKRKVYQRDVAAGELIYMPGAQILQREIDAYNEELAEKNRGYYYTIATKADVEAIEAAVKEKIAKGEIQEGSYANAAVKEGEYLRKYFDENANMGTYKIGDKNVDRNFAGFYLYATDSKNTKELQFDHFTRDYNTVLFAVAEEHVDASLKAPKYTGAEVLEKSGEITLSAIPAMYAEKSDAEITFAIKEGAQYATLEGNVLTAITDAYEKGAKVVIEITQGDLTSDVTIDLGVDQIKYGYLTLEVAGSGEAEVYIGDKYIASNGEEDVEFAIGELVTLKAVADDGNEFAYWAVVSGGRDFVYSSEAELEINVPYDLKLKAVFKPVGETSVTFYGWQKEIIERGSLSSYGDKIVMPEAPEVFGYVFTGYTSAAFSANVYEEGQTINAAMIDKDVIFEANYAVAEALSYTVTVVNGTVNDAEKATVPYNSHVVVKANAAEEGMKFSHWAELGKEDEPISFNEKFEFYMAAADRTVVAVYVDADAEIDVKPVITMTVTVIDEAAADGPIYGLFAERRVPKGYTVVESGIVYGYAGNNYGLTEESEEVTLVNYNGKKASKYQNLNGQYTVRFQMDADHIEKAKGNNWYASSYLIYKDKDGDSYTAYSKKALIGVKEEATPDAPTDVPTED